MNGRCDLCDCEIDEDWGDTVEVHTSRRSVKVRRTHDLTTVCADCKRHRKDEVEAHVEKVKADTLASIKDAGVPAREE